MIWRRTLELSAVIAWFGFCAVIWPLSQPRFVMALILTLLIAVIAALRLEEA